MTAAGSVGATSHAPLDWPQSNGHAVHRNVRRLQARIVQATQVGRWGKVHALQHLLTHSCSGKALAVRRVTENHGNRTPGGPDMVHPMHIKLSTLRKLLWPYRVAIPTIMPANKALPYDDTTTGGPCPA